jgi:hypothetical protein
MKLAMLVATLCYGASDLAFADAIDPLWGSVVAQTMKSNQWVAQDLDITASGAMHGKQFDNVRAKSHLTGWNGDKPIYDWMQLNPKPDSSKPAPTERPVLPDFSKLITEMLQAEAKASRTDDQAAEGQRWTVFEVNEKKIGTTMAFKAWIDPQTGILDHTDMKLHVTLTADVSMSVQYGGHAEAGTFPARTDMTFESLIPFQGGRLHIVADTENWIKRPR